MLDLVGIVFSSVMMLVVIIRAVKLDASVPWFERPAADPARDPGTPGPARASGRPLRSRTPRR